VPKVSVIIPTYNRADRLQGTINSVLLQELADLECIVVDDGSQDSTGETLRRVSDTRLRYLTRNSQSGGPAQPQNDGLAAASGEYIAFLDDDDIAAPNWLSDLSRIARSSANIGMVWGPRAVVDGTGNWRAVAYVNPFSSSAGFPLLPTMLTWTPGTSGLLVRKQVFDTLGCFDPSTGPLADLDFTMRFALCRRWSAGIVDNVGYHHTEHETNLSGLLGHTYLSALRRLVEKHDSTLDQFPAAKAHYFYRLAWVLLESGARREGYSALNAAIRLRPRDPKLVAFKATQLLGLMGVWKRLSAWRVGYGEQLSLSRYRSSRLRGPRDSAPGESARGLPVLQYDGRSKSRPDYIRGAGGDASLRTMPQAKQRAPDRESHSTNADLFRERPGSGIPNGSRG
jgi:glycosyltransferase involved in cell wall biosynthesis